MPRVTTISQSKVLKPRPDRERLAAWLSPKRAACKSPAQILAAPKEATEPWALESAGRRDFQAHSQEFVSHAQLWNTIRHPKKQQWVKEAAGPPRTRQRKPGARSPVAWTAQTHKSWKSGETQSDTRTEKKMRGRERRETETREKRESGGEIQEDRQRGGQRKDWGATESDTRLRKS